MRSRRVARLAAFAVVATTAWIPLAGAQADSAEATATKPDRDGDRLSNRFERRRSHTDPRRKDTDRDTLSDGFEVRRSKTNPRRKDTDRDRLSDRFELKRSKTNPRRKDTDRDGLSDWFEVKRSRTNPRRKDTDRDGLTDGAEVYFGLNPLSANPLPPSPGTAVGPAYEPCTTTVSTVTEAQGAVAAAAPGSTVCLADGAHGPVSLTADKAGQVTLRAANPGRATIGDVTLRGRGLRLAGFVVSGEVTIRAGSSDMSVHRNLISASSFGVFVYGDQGTVSNVSIVANRISNPGQDAIRLHNFRGVAVEANEITGVHETGSHNDVLQTVHGGAGLVFRRNYVHDNRDGQGFFVKDGAVTNVTVEDNLFVRDPGGRGHPISFYDTSPNPADPFYTGYGALVRRNTVWHDNGQVLARGSGNANVLFDRNVAQRPMVCESGSNCAMSGNVVGGGPAFVASAADDYRLGSGAAGVTWRPVDQHYGP